MLEDVVAPREQVETLFVLDSMTLGVDDSSESTLAPAVAEAAFSQSSICIQFAANAVRPSLGINLAIVPVPWVLIVEPFEGKIDIVDKLFLVNHLLHGEGSSKRIVDVLAELASHLLLALGFIDHLQGLEGKGGHWSFSVDLLDAFTHLGHDDLLYARNRTL